MNKVHYGIEGVFSWSVIDAKSGRTLRRSAPKKNLILNQGLDFIATRTFARNFTHCVLGRNFIAPTASDTGMSWEVVRTSTYYTENNGCGGTLVSNALQLKRTFDFPTETVPIEYGQIGWSYTGTAGNNLFSLSLTSNEQGNVAPLVLYPGQFLRVVYTLSITLSPATSTAGSANITGWASTNGNRQVQYLGLESIDSSGNPTNYDSGGTSNEPSSTAADIFVSTNSSALSSFGSAADRSSGATTVAISIPTYETGTYVSFKRGTFNQNVAVSSSLRSVGIGPTSNSALYSTFVHLFDASQTKASGYELLIYITYSWSAA